MSTAPLRILLVDDMKSIVGEVEKALSLISVETNIDFRLAEDPSLPFGCALPTGREFDNYDLALIDLELFPTRSSIYYEPEDLRGGSEVLPYIRSEAPWLPVIAESRLYLSEAEHFLAIAGSFGFDGHLPRGIFRKGVINLEMWESLTNGARDLRRKAVIGDNLWQSRQRPLIEETSQARNTLDSRYENWRELLQLAFCFSRKVVLSQLKGGFSGANVFKAYARPTYEDGSSEGEWLVKISNSPWKLHQEVQAHRAMTRGGLDFARAVPLLWTGVLTNNRTAIIVYQFARNTKEASEFLESEAKILTLFAQLQTILKRFYRSPRLERSIISRIISEWGPSAAAINKAVEQLSKSDVKNMLRSIASGDESGELSENIEYHRCLVHGDLHLGNIMLGENDVMIDFALSGDGPLALDAAKLISDLLLRSDALRDVKLPSWDNNVGLIDEILSKLRDLFVFNEGDKKLFSMFLIINLAVALSYDDVSKGTKNWIKKTLTKEELSVK